MRVKDLFMQCEPHQIYCFLKERHNLGSFSEREFNKRIASLLANDEQTTEDFYLICSPYICKGSANSDRDIFLVYPKEVKESIDKQRSPFDTMMLCDRVECDCTSISNVMNAKICPLSTSTFYPYEVCAEIFFAIALSLAEIDHYTSQQALAFLQNIKDTIMHEEVPSKFQMEEKTKRLCRDVESSMKQNTMFYYPYFVSVAKNCEN